MKFVSISAVFSKESQWVLLQKSILVFLGLGLIPFLPGTPGACHTCTVTWSKNITKFRLSGVDFKRRFFSPCSEKAQWAGFPCSEGSFPAHRCTAAWNDFPSTRRGRLHHQPSGAWARRRTIGWTAWGAWRAGTAAGSLALLKCEFCANESSVLPQQLRKASQNFLWPVFSEESFLCCISTREAWVE